MEQIHTAAWYCLTPKQRTGDYTKAILRLVNGLNQPLLQSNRTCGYFAGTIGLVMRSAGRDCGFEPAVSWEGLYIWKPA
ncbi:hypothetical protein J6590_063316 [Homalodisca vitripennis]|nr:hypothetical protein J6590_063316 [Homalodisca vitripennis]